MKINFLITFTILVVTTAFSQENFSNTFEMKKLEKEILAVVNDWNKSFLQNDPERYFGFIHEDITLFVTSSPYRIDGKMDDREEFEWSLSKGNTRVSLFQELQPKVQILSDNSAVVSYYNRGAYGPEGQEHMIYLKETNVMVKEDNGWKIIHIHVSK